MRGRKFEAALSYFGFIGFVVISLFVARPKPDLFPLDYSVLSSSYSGLLAGLGGFAITVLAVMLGLEALDVHRSSEAAKSAHTTVVRHVSVSLSIAAVTCFISAQLLGEVSAQASAIERAKTDASGEITQFLRASGLPESRITWLTIQMDQARRSEPFFGRSDSIDVASRAITAPPIAKALEDRVADLKRVFVASPRRLVMIAAVPAFISSLLILQSLTFLLLIRFPEQKSIGTLQNIVVLAFGAILLVKVLHTCSYGLEGSALLASRIGVGVVFLAVIGLYRSTLRFTLGLLRKTPEKFTPILPYAMVLIVVFSLTVFLAGSFSRVGPPSAADRLIAGLGALIVTALLITIQVEKPTLSLLEEITAE